jgi:hypothetical protein
LADRPAQRVCAGFSPIPRHHLGATTAHKKPLDAVSPLAPCAATVVCFVLLSIHCADWLEFRDLFCEACGGITIASQRPPFLYGLLRSEMYSALTVLIAYVPQCVLLLARCFHASTKAGYPHERTLRINR